MGRKRSKNEGLLGMEVGSEKRKFSLLGVLLAGLAILGLFSTMDN